jgi:hypothetical protein
MAKQKELPRGLFERRGVVGLCSNAARFGKPYLAATL